MRTSSTRITRGHTPTFLARLTGARRIAREGGAGRTDHNINCSLAPAVRRHHCSWVNPSRAGGAPRRAHRSSNLSGARVRGLQGLRGCLIGRPGRLFCRQARARRYKWVQPPFPILSACPSAVRVAAVSPPSGVEGNRPEPLENFDSPPRIRAAPDTGHQPCECYVPKETLAHGHNSFEHVGARRTARGGGGSAPSLIPPRPPAADARPRLCRCPTSRTHSPALDTRGVRTVVFTNAIRRAPSSRRGKPRSALAHRGTGTL